ncbi:MAG: outer membrane protein assembly factor BamB family protein [Planctomycetota bacterium]
MDYPLLPTYAAVDGRNFVVFTDGFRTVAVDPGRVTSDSDVRGVWWKYPEDGPIRPPTSRSSTRGALVTAPYTGCAVSGRTVFATMCSERRRKPDESSSEPYVGPTAIKAFDMRTGGKVWDTDHVFVVTEKGKRRAAMEQYEFSSGGWAFSAPPIVRGKRLYAGISSGPTAEQEARVICLDRDTGRPVWCTFIASAGGAFDAWGRRGQSRTYLTMIAEQGGVVYVSTNLGVAAALNSVTGSVLWITEYKRDKPQYRRGEEAFARPPNPPVVHRGRLYCLTQDSGRLRVFAAATGEPLDAFVDRLQSAGAGHLEWKNVTHLMPVNRDWMLLGGTPSRVLNFGPDKMRMHRLTAASTGRCGWGRLQGRYLYLPGVEPQARPRESDVLALYDISTWRLVFSSPWRESGSSGNLLLAGDYLVVATDKVEIYSSTETLYGRFAERLRRTPKDPAVLLEIGDVMRDNGRAGEAADWYLKFIAAAEGDAKYEGVIRRRKLELHHLYLEQGVRALKDDPDTAVTHLQRARGFAYDQKTRTDATLKLAEAYENAGNPADAVGQYREILRGSRDAFRLAEDDGIEKAWVYAERRIGELIAANGRAVYETVEKEARQALERIEDADAAALKRFIEEYPNSASVQDAFRRWLDVLWEKGRFDRIPSAWERFRRKYADRVTREMWEKMIGALEKRDDFDRLRRALRDYADAFGSERRGGGTVTEWAADKIAEVNDRQAALRRPPETLSRAAVVPPGADAKGMYGLSTVPVLLRPLGIRPASFGADRALVLRGSTVELWKTGAAPEKLWSLPHPGGYLGVVHTDVQAGKAPGVKVHECLEGSPAAAAGVTEGDVIVILDGRVVGPEDFDRVLLEKAPGSEVELVLEKGGVRRSVKVRLAEHPAGMVPAVVGAAYTRDCRLAVAWQDVVASIDLEKGSVAWTFGAVRPLFHVGGFHAVDGLLFVHETLGKGGRNPLGHFTTEYREGAGKLAPEDQHSRLICLDDAYGSVIWGRTFRLTVVPGGTDILTFASPYLSDWVAMLREARGNASQWKLHVLEAQTGRHVRSLPVQGNLMAHRFDVERGELLWVDGQRVLRSYSLVPGRLPARNFATHLQGNHFPSPHRYCSLASSGERVALAVLPYGQDNPGRVVLFSAEDRREVGRIALPEGRVLLPGLPNPIAADAQGMLYVYNVSVQERISADHGAFLTAYRLSDAPGSEPAWEAPAPGRGANDRTPLTLEFTQGHVFFFSRNAAFAQGESSRPCAAVYERKRGGYVSRFWEEVVDRPGRRYGLPGPAGAHGGRVYVSTTGGLEIFGE